MVKKFSRKHFIIIFLISYGIAIVPIIMIVHDLSSNQPFLMYLNPKDPPFHIHASWSNKNASTTITFTWKTKITYINYIRYDLISKIGNESSYMWENRSNVQFSNGWIHTVALPNLTPNTTYYFICGSDISEWSSELKFKTPELSPNEIIFAVGGDSRSNIEIRNNISELIANYSPEFVLHTGDIVNDGRIQSLWNIWFDGMQKYWKTNDSRIIPIIPTLGNHEQNAPNYYAQFSLPNNEQWYSIDYSSLVHIICLNSETDIEGEQLEWLKNDLKQYNNTIWKFVFFHQPPYTSGTHSSRIDIREKWCPLFDTYNVSIVFNGHCHLYERSVPIKYNSTSGSYLNGTMYVTTGGWGGPLHSVDPRWWTAYNESEYHFCLVNITTNLENSTLELKQIRLNNTIGDSITVVRSLI